MGFLDDAIGAVKGAVLEGAENSAQGILHNALGNSALGGLSGLVGQLQSSGLGDMVSSWPVRLAGWICVGAVVATNGTLVASLLWARAR